MPKLPEQQVGRYAIFDQIAIGGMARVHLARLTGQEGFSRVVAVKRMHRHLLDNEDFKRMFLAEARMAARVRHPNVVPILDVLSLDDELVLVMEYVHGEPLHVLLQACRQASTPIPESIACAVVMATLHGLHAAHEAKDEKGEPLGLVHRDVSPQNILVGTDGVARVVDFGVAKAVRAQQETNPGVIKGKFSYMAPELIRGAPATRQSDVFSTAVVFWELVTGRKLFGGATEQERLLAILAGQYPSPRQFAPEVSRATEQIILKGLKSNPATRYGTALEMAIAIERDTATAPPRVIGEWVASKAAGRLAARTELIHDIEMSTVSAVQLSMSPPSIPSSTASGIRSFPSSRRHRSILFGAGAAIAGTVAVVGLIVATHSSGPSRELAPPAEATARLAAPQPKAGPAPSPSAKQQPAPTVTAPALEADEPPPAVAGGSAPETDETDGDPETDEPETDEPETDEPETSELEQKTDVQPNDVSRRRSTSVGPSPARANSRVARPQANRERHGSKDYLPNEL